MQSPSCIFSGGGVLSKLSCRTRVFPRPSAEVRWGPCSSREVGAARGLGALSQEHWVASRLRVTGAHFARHDRRDDLDHGRCDRRRTPERSSDGAPALRDLPKVGVSITQTGHSLSSERCVGSHFGRRLRPHVRPLWELSLRELSEPRVSVAECWHSLSSGDLALSAEDGVSPHFGCGLGPHGWALWGLSEDESGSK